MHFTVSSPRIDNIIAAAYGLSRRLATEAILAGRVFVNGVETTKPDMSLKGGEKIVLRGKGKAIYHGINGTSKKGSCISAWINTCKRRTGGGYMDQKELPRIAGKLRSKYLEMPEEIYRAKGIVIMGKRIKSVIFTTDIAIIRSCNADAVLAVLSVYAAAGDLAVDHQRGTDAGLCRCRRRHYQRRAFGDHRQGRRGRRRHGAW